MFQKTQRFWQTHVLWAAILVVTAHSISFTVMNTGAPKLNTAQSIAISSSGQYVVIADTENQTICVLDMRNTTQLWFATVGVGHQSFVDGDGTVAAFQSPRGVALVEFDSNGTLSTTPLAIIVADTNNHRIRRVSWSGMWVVSTLGGSLSDSRQQLIDGNASTSGYHSPKGIVVVGNDTAYIADCDNYAIRKLIISTNETSTLKTLSFTPTSIAFQQLTMNGGVALWVGTATAPATVMMFSVDTNRTVSLSISGRNGIAVCTVNGTDWVYTIDGSTPAIVHAINASNTSIIVQSTVTPSSALSGLTVNHSDGGLLALNGSSIGWLSFIALNANTTSKLPPFKIVTSTQSHTSMTTTPLHSQTPSESLMISATHTSVPQLPHRARTSKTVTKLTPELTISKRREKELFKITSSSSLTTAENTSVLQAAFNSTSDLGVSTTANEVAAGIMVTIVTGASAIVSAAASTGASIALLSSLGSCDDDRPKDTVMVYVLSPFYSLGAVAIALGNVGLAMALTALHALLVVLHHRCTAHSQNVEASELSSLWVGHYHRSMQALRFPTLSLRMWQLMLPGAVFGAMVSVLGDDVHVDGVRNLGESPIIAAGVAVLFIAALYHAAEGYFLWWKVLPSLTFAAWPKDVAIVLFRSRVDRILLYPSGRWVPNSMSELVAAPLLPMRSTQLEPLRFVEVSIAYFLAVCNALNRSSVFSSTCSVLPIFLVLLYSMHAILLGVVRPHRNPADSFFATFSSVVYAAISLNKSLRTTTSGQSAVSGLQWCISAMMLVSCAYALWVRHVIARTLLVTNANDDVTTDNIKANIVATVPVRQQIENVSLTDIMDVYATGEGEVDHDDLEINIIVNSSEGLYTNSNNNHYATVLEDSKDLDLGDQQQQQQQYLPAHNRTLLESMMGEQYPPPRFMLHGDDVKWGDL
ncbi:membrane-associated protein, putative [Bodo saltans]|uniref:Membrane-associated protein, putative n=1 Tax=Bodo saltans TaxID=75058 RepID=A0A0S4JFX7_BODSA|nr:membrane-associated protein, putative [Bodo saltans]|eukprot:CUG89044.1 membrane-associated protein, putative [Bodo saltans]